jgi:ATP/maltotriose-dependent transcriptional regulator MalT
MLPERISQMQPGLVSPVFVGRGAELASMLAAFESAVMGDPTVAIVGGEAGVGKTRLVEEVAARARDADARVLIGSCIELGGAGLPLSPVVDALRSLMRVMNPNELEPLLGPARDELARLLPELSPDRGTSLAPVSEEGSARLLELVFGVIQRLAAAQPLMLVIEDLHWADRSTLDLVALLVRALRDVRVLLVVTFRSDELHRGHALRPLVTGWERVRSVRRLELQRFSLEETAGQLEAILGAPPERSMLELLYERSEGNAFLIEEILGTLQEGASPDALPMTLRDVLLARAERLSSPTLGLLRVASAAGRSVPDRLLSIVSDLDEPSLDEALREAVEHHLLVVDETGQGYRFRHALTRDAIYGDALPRERVRIHRAYAEALSDDPALAGTDASVAAALALHWSAAHDLPRALEASIEAARLAAAYAPAEALRHFEHGLELWPSVPDASERCGMDVAEALRLAAMSAYAAGEVERSIALYDEALAEVGDSGDVERIATLLGAKAGPLTDLGREEATEVLERAVAILPGEPPTVARAAALVELTARRALIEGDLTGVAAAEQALAAALAAGAREEEAMARMWVGICRTYLGDEAAGIAELRRAVELAEELGAHALALRTYVNLSDALEVAGRHSESADVARRGLELAAQVGLTRHVYGGYLVANRAEALMRLGRWSEAHELLTGAIDSGLARWVAQAQLMTLRGTIAALCGRYQEAARDMDAASAIAGVRDEAQFALSFELGRALVALATGDRAQARVLVREALEGGHEVLEGRYRLPLLWLGLRIEAEAPDPQRERVEWLRSLAARVPASTPSSRTYRALAVAEAGRADGVHSDWLPAVESARAEGDPYLQAYALLRSAGQALAAGDRDSAAPMLAESTRLSAEMGADPLLVEARTLARRARMRLSEPELATTRTERDINSYGLTERELEVLQLVAAGRSNPQIATELFISPKTASVHVSNIISKLNVASRGEAAAVAHRLGIAV